MSRFWVFGLVVVMVLAGGIVRAAENSGAKPAPAIAEQAVPATAAQPATKPATAEKLPQFAKASEALKAGRYEEALGLYREAEGAATSPQGRGNAANGMGYACMKMHKPAEAVTHFEKAVQADPGNKTAWNNLGSCQLTMYESGQAGPAVLESAVSAFEKVAALDPGHKPDNLKAAQEMAAREKGWAEAAAKRAAGPAATVPTGGTYPILKAAGEKAEQEGDFALAAGCFGEAEKVSTTKKGKSAGANMLGLLALKQRDPKAATDNFRRATTQDPTNKYAWNNLGVTLISSCNAGLAGKEAVEEAVGAFKKVNELDPQYKPENLKGAEDMLAEMGGSEKAAEASPAAPVAETAPAVPAKK
jgi:tetratricopeptide (TPR) repeat protein